jgi:CheY-like chemotaxis protein
MSSDVAPNSGPAADGNRILRGSAAEPHRVIRMPKAEITSMPIRITVIDDSRESTLWLLRSMPEGGELQTISSSPFFDQSIEDAIVLFSPDLILLDLLLEANVQSGFRVLRSLRMSARTTNIPVVVYSKFIGPSKDDRYRLDALRFGAVGALSKIPPIAFQDLMPFIKTGG